MGQHKTKAPSPKVAVGVQYKAGIAMKRAKGINGFVAKGTPIPAAVLRTWGDPIVWIESGHVDVFSDGKKVPKDDAPKLVRKDLNIL